MSQTTRITLDATGSGFAASVDAGAPLAIEALLIGRPVEEAAQILPRLFNLCRAAQTTAARLALGLPMEDGRDLLAQEVLRDHMLKLFLIWPGHLGLPVQAFPPADRVAEALFGPRAQVPASLVDFWLWVDSATGVAPLIRAIAQAFAPEEAVADLPMVTAETVFGGMALENSPALRHPDHPVLAGLAQSHGRGPLWRAVARLVDAEACLAGALPDPLRLQDGTVLTPAARGVYGVRARAEGGRVTAFQRVTPTDHMLAPHGMLAQSFASLPQAKAGLARLVLDMLDPCVPVELVQTP